MIVYLALLELFVFFSRSRFFKNTTFFVGTTALPATTFIAAEPVRVAAISQEDKVKINSGICQVETQIKDIYKHFADIIELADVFDYPKNGKKEDIDNYQKLVSDLIKKGKASEGDFYLPTSLTARTYSCKHRTKKDISAFILVQHP